MAADIKGMQEFHWLANMVETVEVGLVVLDLDYRVQVWNGFMENHSGLTASQVHDQNLFEVIPALPEPWLRRKLETATRLNIRTFTSWEQRPWVFQFGNPRPVTGTSDCMYQNMTISPLSGPDGQVQKLCLMIYDVTDLAVSKQALASAEEKLLQRKERS